MADMASMPGPPAGQSCYLTPAVRPAKGPVGAYVAGVRTHVRNTVGTRPRLAGFEEHTGFWPGQGSCRTGDCSTVEVAHDSRIQPGPGGWPARSRPGRRRPDARTPDRFPQRDRADDGRC